MLRYLVLVVLYIKKQFLFIQAQEELDANFSVFQADIERNLKADTQKLATLQAKNQADKTPEEMMEEAELEQQVDRTHRLRKMKEKAERELASAEQVINVLRDKLLFRKQ